MNLRKTCLLLIRSSPNIMFNTKAQIMFDFLSPKEVHLIPNLSSTNESKADSEVHCVGESNSFTGF